MLKRIGKLGLSEKLLVLTDWNSMTELIAKGGVIFADFLNTVSPTYAKRDSDKEFFGLEGLLKERKNVLSGILNGIDYSVWDPDTDKFILHNYSCVI